MVLDRSAPQKEPAVLSRAREIAILELMLPVGFHRGTRLKILPHHAVFAL